MPKDPKIRVMIVDDHSIIRDGLQELLEHTGEFEVVAQAGDGEAALRIVEDAKPEVIILDLIMPAGNGIDICRQLKESVPDAEILILTAVNEEEAVVDAVAAGAKGFLHKYAGKDKLISAVRGVAEGEYRVPEETIRNALTRLRSPASSSSPPRRGRPAAVGGAAGSDTSLISQREQEILSLYARGLSYGEVADIVGRRPLTIRNTIYSIQSKLGAKTKQELVVWAVRNGLLEGTADS